MKKVITTAIGVIIIMALMILGISKMEFNDHEYTATITDKERVVQDDSSYYLIFAEEDNGNLIVFKNEDTFVRGKFNSSDVYGMLKEGSKYDFTVVGYRIPLFSLYENIIDFKEV